MCLIKRTRKIESICLFTMQWVISYATAYIREWKSEVRVY